MRSRLSAIDALMFFRLKVSEAAVNTAISSTPASMARSSPLQVRHQHRGRRRRGAPGRGDLGRVRELRDPARADEAGGLDGRQPRGGEALDELDLDRRRHHGRFVLQPVARPDLDDPHAGGSDISAALVRPDVHQHGLGVDAVALGAQYALDDAGDRRRSVSSIFMPSMISSGWPASTRSPARTLSATMVPGMGATGCVSCSPWPDFVGMQRLDDEIPAVVAEADVHAAGIGRDQRLAARSPCNPAAAGLRRVPRAARRGDGCPNARARRRRGNSRRSSWRRPAASSSLTGMPPAPAARQPSPAAHGDQGSSAAVGSRQVARNPPGGHGQAPATAAPGTLQSTFSSSRSRKPVSTSPAAKRRVRGQRAQQRQVGRDAGDGGVGERLAQPAEALGAIEAVHDQLGEQRVVMMADLVTLLDARVEADGRMPVGRAQAPDAAGGGHEVVGRVLRVDARLDGVAAPRNLRLRQRQGSPEATRSCHSTRSRPVTISVTGCSTCSRVFISMNQNSRSGLTMNSTVPAFR
jgi:hypothetical protein